MNEIFGIKGIEIGNVYNFTCERYGIKTYSGGVRVGWPTGRFGRLGSEPFYLEIPKNGRL